MAPCRTATILLTLALVAPAFAQAASQDASSPPPKGRISVPAGPECWGDFDRDGFLDLLVPNGGGEVLLLRNRGDGAFENVAPRAGLGWCQGVRRGLWQDFDRDGYPDLLVLTAGPGRLFRNLGDGTFAEVTGRAGLPADEVVLDAAWIDYDRDTYPDLWIEGPSGHRLYRNRRWGTFEEVHLPCRTIAPAQDPDGAPPPAPGDAVPTHGDPEVSHRAPSAAPPPGGTPIPATGTPLVYVCADQLRDQGTGGCGLQASTTPTLGLLYPLSQALFVGSTGAVGIGTTTPGPEPEVRLHVAPGGSTTSTSIKVSGYYAGLRLDADRTGVGGTPHIEFFRIGQPRSSIYVDYAANQLRFSVAGSDRMVIDPSGNVGIGTTAPQATLHVAGETRLDGWLSVQNNFATVTNASGLIRAGMSPFGHDPNMNPVYDHGTLGTLGGSGSYPSRVNAMLTCPMGQTDRGLVGVYHQSWPKPRAVMSVDPTGAGFVAVYHPSTPDLPQAGISAGPWGGGIGICDGRSSQWQGFIYFDAPGRVAVSANIKSFREPNPNDPATDIWYACVEGPEAAAYVRGTARLVNGAGTITLPDHFRAVTVAEGMTVQVTPLSADSKGLAVVRKGLDGVDVRELLQGAGTYEFDYEVKAVRKGYEDYRVIRPRSEVPGMEGGPHPAGGR